MHHDKRGALVSTSETVMVTASFEQQDAVNFCTRDEKNAFQKNFNPLKILFSEVQKPLHAFWNEAMSVVTSNQKSPDCQYVVPKIVHS